MIKKKSSFGCLSIIVILVLLSSIVFLIIYKFGSINFVEKYNELIKTLRIYISEIENGNEQPVIDRDLILPDEEKLTGAQRYFYYQQLSQTGKKIYVTIENNIENLKNGEDNIPLPASLNDDVKLNDLGKEYIAQEFQNAWDALMTDRSEYFYLDSSKVCLVTKIISKGSNKNYEFYIGKGDNKNYFSKEFSSLKEIESAIDEVEKVKNDILKDASGSNYKKILYIHDWIVENNKYDTLEKPHNNNIYGCLVNKISVCEGYARAYKYLLDELNIPCILISGTAIDENGKTERHAWNYVYINNNWYAIDTTWDDPIIIGNGKITDAIKYKYFLKGKETMDKDHMVIGQITKNGKDFQYPELAEKDLQ